MNDEEPHINKSDYRFRPVAMGPRYGGFRTQKVQCRVSGIAYHRLQHCADLMGQRPNDVIRPILEAAAGIEPTAFYDLISKMREVVRESQTEAMNHWHKQKKAS